MALILSNVADLYFYLNDEISDPRTRDKLFMSNPFPMFGILTIYLVFILKWGPAFMKNRQPYKLDWLISIYNVVQIVVCADLVRLTFKHAYRPNGYDILCEPVDYSMNEVAMIAADGCHTYFLLKLLDLMDTVFFVLRKKDKQVTFLHLYHHTGMVVLTWNATKFLAGGHGVFTGFINSIIHIIMYTYYLVALISPKYKNNLWWKKYITQMQMIQFFLIIIHWLAILFQPDCKFPKFAVAVMVPQNLFMLVLFGDFYRKAYMRKKPTAASIANKKPEISNQDTCLPDTDSKSRKRAVTKDLNENFTFIEPGATIHSKDGNESNECPKKLTVNGNFLKDVHYT